jgi:branched-chain amino acid transport system substrate-binding protein
MVAMAVVGIIIFSYKPRVEAADPKKTEILFGGSLAISGPLAEIGRLSKDAFELWVEDTNKAGGIYVKEYGRKLPVKWVLYDDRSDPATGAKLYEKLITYDKVDFLTPPFSSGITFASSVVCEKYKKILISSTGATDEIYNRGFDYVLCHIGFASNHMNSNIDLIKNLNPRPKAIAIAVAKSLYALTAGEATRKKLQDLRFEIVLYEEFPSDIKDASSIINKMKSLNPDIFLGFSHPPSAALFTKQMKDLNFRPKMIYLNEGPEMGWYLKEFGKDAEGMVSRFASYAAPKNPRFIEFSKRVKKKDPTWPREEADSIYHCGPYDTVELFRKGIEATGTLDNTKILEYFRTHEIPDLLVGLDQKAIFKDLPGNYKNININVVPVATQIQNGKIVEIWPAMFAQAKTQYPLPPWPK